MSKRTRLNPNITQADLDSQLGNVDNTADIDKPVSTDQQTAIDVVANASVGRALVTAKGDLIVGTGSATVDNLPAGPTNGTVLTVDSTAATGLAWTTLTAVQPAAEMFHTFTKDADGAFPGTLDSGHTPVISYNRIAAIPVILGGRYISNDYSAASSGIGYVTAHLLGGPATFMEADFDFDNIGSTNTHTAVMASYIASYVAGGSPGTPPDSPCHCVFLTDHMEYGIYSAGVLTVIGRYFYTTPFTTQTQHVEIRIDRANAIATVLAPDGATLQFTDPLIGSLSASYVSAEIYRPIANTAKAVRFQKWAATSASLTVGGGGGGGALTADSVGWVELDASGTPSATTFLKVAADGSLSAAVPSTTGTPAADSVGWVELNATGTPTSTTFLKVAASGALSVATPSSSAIPGSTASGWANVVVDHGADPTGGSDSGPAFRAAAATGKPIYIPSGTFQYNGAGMSGQTLHIQGMGNNQTSVLLGAGVYFVDSSQQFISFYMSGIRFTGGAGHVRNTFPDSNVTDLKIVEDCWFKSYTNCSIQTNSFNTSNNGDQPYWKIYRCIFNGASVTTSMGIAFKGLTDGIVIQDCEFLRNRVHVKLDRGNNTYIRGNDFIRFSPATSFPLVDLWFVPVDTAQIAQNNGGSGCVVTENKFGNENLSGGDFRILYADELSPGTWYGDRWPDTTNTTGKMLRGHMIHSNLIVGNGSGQHALVHSFVTNLQGMCIGTNMLAGISFTPLLRLATATGFNHVGHIVGPLVCQYNATINQLSPPAFVVAQSGTLSGQPKVL